MTEKVYGSIMLVCCGTALTVARRWKNSDPNAGYGVAGWTMFGLLMIWIFR